jgi:FKBP-type peptidyl-prolyl cis-trans isomerase FkpA
MKNLIFLFSICLLWSCENKPTTTPSGYTYIHHVKNSGPKPQKGEEAEFVVDIRNETTVVNSSRQTGQPAKFLIPETGEPQKSISPIVEALQVMAIGDSLTILQSIDSFPRKPPGFENSEFVYYDIVLQKINSKEAIEKERAAEMEKMKANQAREAAIGTQTEDLMKKYLDKKLGGDLKTTESGLKYYVIEAGTGKQVENGSFANVHYYGITTDGKMFDNSFRRGAPYPVPVGRGQVIKGWDEGLQLFKEGTKAILFIPGELGYGAAGSPPNIGPNAELVFYIEIDKVQ